MDGFVPNLVYGVLSRT